MENFFFIQQVIKNHMKLKKIISAILVSILVIGICAGVVSAVFKLDFKNHKKFVKLKNSMVHYELDKKINEDDLIVKIIDYQETLKEQNAVFSENLIEKHLYLYFEKLIINDMQINQQEKTLKLHLKYELNRNKKVLTINLNWKILFKNDYNNPYEKEYYDNLKIVIKNQKEFN